MKKIRTDDLQPGMVLAKTIYATDGRVLAKENAAISDMLLRRLQSLGLPAAYIQDPGHPAGAEIISEATRMDAVNYLSRLETEIRSGRNDKILHDKKILNHLVYEVIAGQKNGNFLTDIRLHQGYIHGHSVNVCAWAIRIGLSLEYTTAKLEELAIGALFHDIGMYKVPLEILHKTAPLTKQETEKLNSHPQAGFDLLKQNWNFPAVSAHVAYQHHERFNGTGYPRRLAGEAIHEYARITAVVDVFDAMTSERVYRPAFSVPETVRYLIEQRGIQFDPRIVAVFLEILED